MIKQLRDIFLGLQGTRKPPVVFVCGLGGSGKSTFCKNMAESLGDNSAVVHSDWYVFHGSPERKRRIGTALQHGDPHLVEREENPANWYAWDFLRRDLEYMRQTGELMVEGLWNQLSGQKDLTVQLQMKNPEQGIIFCDGIYLLSSPVRDLADVIVFLDVPKETVVERVKKRDAHRSSEQYLAYKMSLIDKYDLPYCDQNKEHAHIIVNNTTPESPTITKCTINSTVSA